MATIDLEHRLAFPRLTDDEIAAVAGMAELRPFADGEALITAGERGFPFYVVESGVVTIMDESGDEPKQVGKLVLRNPRRKSSTSDLWDDVPQFALASQEPRNSGLPDTKPLCQLKVRAFVALIRGDDSAPQIQRQAIHGPL